LKKNKYIIKEKYIKTMENLSLIDTFSEFKELKNINRETLMHVLADVFKGLLQKKYEASDNFDIIINIDKGDLEIWHNRTIVEDKNYIDPNTQIPLSEAKKIEEDYEIGEEVSKEVKLEDFGRRSILSLRQNLTTRILELEKDNLFSKYKERVGEIVAGEVYQIWKKEILVLDDEGNELLLPKTEQIPSDYFRKSDPIRAVVARVEMKNNTPIIVLSRTAPEFLERLFELEVPEIYDGLITIKKIVRSAGERAKVAVESYDDRIDPVGACVGVKGTRIHGIVRELRNENIDVINFTNNLQLYISRALSPATITHIKVNEEKKRAEVFLDPEEVSKAIGKGGMNIKLASQLVGYELDVFRNIDESEDVEDVVIDEFSDEIEEWVLNELKAIGCDTAKSVLELTREELVERTDLEEETVDEVLQIFRNEFE